MASAKEPKGGMTSRLGKLLSSSARSPPQPPAPGPAAPAVAKPRALGRDPRLSKYVSARAFNRPEVRAGEGQGAGNHPADHPAPCLRAPGPRWWRTGRAVARSGAWIDAPLLSPLPPPLAHPPLPLLPAAAPTRRTQGVGVQEVLRALADAVRSKDKAGRQQLTALLLRLFFFEELPPEAVAAMLPLFQVRPPAGSCACMLDEAAQMGVAVGIPQRLRPLHNSAAACRHCCLPPDAALPPHPS